MLFTYYLVLGRVTGAGKSLGSFCADEVWADVTCKVCGIVLELICFASEKPPRTLIRLTEEKAL